MNLTILSRFAKQMVSHVPIRKQEFAYPVVVIVLALAYLIAGRFGLQFAIIHENVSLVWAASAIAVSAMLLGGQRLWPGVALGAFLVNITTGAPLLSVLLITFGNTLGPVLATYILCNVVPFNVTFDRIKDVVIFAIGGVLVASLITSIIGTLALVMIGNITDTNILAIWLEWFMGDSIGILVLTPLIMLWWKNYKLTSDYRRWLEVTVLGICVVAVSLIIFQPSAYRIGNYPLTYLTIPFTLWVALRFGARGASTICFVIAVAAIAGVARQLQLRAYLDVHQDLIYLWTFIALVTLSTLVLAAIVMDRKRIERELARERDYMAQMVNAMRHGVAVTDIDGRFEYVNPAYANMLGFAPEDLIGKIPKNILPADERATVSNTALRLTSDFNTVYETRFERPNTEPIDVLVNGSLRRDAGVATGIITSITDLTEQKKTEAALRRNEALLQTIFNHVPFDLWVRDADGRCIFQTPQSVRLRGNLLGMTIDDMDVLPEVREEWRLSNARVIAGETLYRDVSYIFDGEERHFFAIKTPITYNKTKLGIMGVNVDITERVQAQKALSLRQEESRLFLEQLKALQDITIELARIDDFDKFCLKAVELGRNRLKFERAGLWLVDADDPDFTIGTFGTAEDGTIRDERNVRTRTSVVLPQLSNMVEVENKKVYFKGDSELHNEYSQPVGYGWKATGHLFDGDQIIGGLSIDNYFTHSPAQPNQLEILALFSNMLGHLCVLKRAETKLHASEERFRSVFTGVNVGIALANARGRIVSVNPAFTRLLGYTQAEFLEMTIGDVTHHDDLEGTTTLFQELLQGQRDFYQMEKRYRCKNGEYVWVRLNATRFPGEGEARTIAVVEDISARKQVEAEIQRINTNLEQLVAERTAELQAANERLTELDRLKTKFIADVTHELRTPLTVLSTRVYLLQHSAPEKHPVYLMGLKEQLERLSNFVDATLDLSRLELGHDRIAFGPVDLNNVIQQVVMALEPRAEIGGLQMTFRSNPVPEVRGEFNQLAQVVTNLVANAINYTPNGSITVRTAFEEAQQLVYLEVTDTGMGISEADIPHLFTRFYRGERAGQTSIPGTGLGLSIVKEIVDLHEGNITVQSSVGRGTTFKVYLPIYKQPQ